MPLAMASGARADEILAALAGRRRSRASPARRKGVLHGALDPDVARRAVRGDRRDAHVRSAARSARRVADRRVRRQSARRRRTRIWRRVMPAHRAREHDHPVRRALRAEAAPARRARAQPRSRDRPLPERTRALHPRAAAAPGPIDVGAPTAGDPATVAAVAARVRAAPDGRLAAGARRAGALFRERGRLGRRQAQRGPADRALRRAPIPEARAHDRRRRARIGRDARPADRRDAPRAGRRCRPRRSSGRALDDAGVDRRARRRARAVRPRRRWRPLSAADRRRRVVAARSTRCSPRAIGC